MQKLSADPYQLRGSEFEYMDEEAVAGGGNGGLGERSDK